MFNHPNIDSARFRINSVVYRRVDRDNAPCLVTGIIIRPTGIIYIVATEDGEQEYYDIELESGPCWILKEDSYNED